MWPYSLFHKFYPIEKIILNTVAERSIDSIKHLLLARIKEVNLVQRHADSKEVNLYTIKGGKVIDNPATRIPVDAEEYKYAVLTMQVENKIFKVDVWIVRGNLFSLTFNRSPKNYLKRTDAVFLEVKVNYPAVTDSHPDQINTKFPVDYLTINPDFIGAEFSHWTVFCINKIKHVVLQSDNYYVLAESNDDQYLMVKQYSQDGMVYYTRHDSIDVVVMGQSFCTALDKLNKC